MDDENQELDSGLSALGPEEEEGEETASITAAARETVAPPMPAVSNFALEEYKAARDAYSKAYSGESGVLAQIQKARKILESQPTQKTRSEYVQGLAQALSAPRERTDPRFYERKNLYTFLRDVGQYGAAEEKAQKEAELKKKLDLLKLDELAAKYGQEEAGKRFTLASQLLRAQRAGTSAAAKEDEITRLQRARRNLDISDPEQAREYNEITKRLAYLGGEREEKGPEMLPGQKEFDRKMADEYADWTFGGKGAQAASRIARLNDVVGKLESDSDISGPVVGYTLENLPTLSSILYPKAQDAKDVVESVIQTDLRAILGGQFAQEEGKALVKRAYNPRLQEWQNANRLKLLSLQMRLVAEDKNKAMNYFGKKGTMMGYEFKPYTYNDFLTPEMLNRLDSGEDIESVARSIIPTGKPTAEEKPKGEQKPKPAGGGAPAGGNALTDIQKAAKAELDKRNAQKAAATKKPGG